MEQSHGLCETLGRQREEAQREAERLKTGFRDMERTLGTRERAHRHRVKGLEEQVQTHRLGSQGFDTSHSLLQYMSTFT